MYLYFQQIEDLLKIIGNNQKIAKEDFGAEFITPDDKLVLLKYGVDFNKLYVKTPSTKTVFSVFNLAMLAESLREIAKINGGFAQLEAFVKKGKYLPESKRDTLIVECLSNLPFTEIRNQPYFDFIREQIIEGAKEKKPLTKVVSDIGHKTGNWLLYDILAYYQKYAWEQVRAMEIKERASHSEISVYKSVHAGCCEDCVRLFLIGGFKSAPRVFVLSELEANGSNIGKDINLWKPTIGPVHYGCTCSLHQVPKGYLWSNEKKSFAIPDPAYLGQTEAKRPLIEV